MAGLLQLDGYELVADPNGADLVVVNTCGFIADARAESHAVIEEMLRLKEQKRLGKVIVTGCLAERDRETLLEKYPQIDQLIGVFARDEIVVRSHGSRSSGRCFSRRQAVPCPIAAADESRCRIWRI